MHVCERRHRPGKATKMEQTDACIQPETVSHHSQERFHDHSITSRSRYRQKLVFLQEDSIPTRKRPWHRSRRKWLRRRWISMWTSSTRSTRSTWRRTTRSTESRVQTTSLLEWLCYLNVESWIREWLCYNVESWIREWLCYLNVESWIREWLCYLNVESWTLELPCYLNVSTWTLTHEWTF